MKKGTKYLYLLLAAGGMGLLWLGKFVFTTEAQKALSGSCFGLGAAALALGLGNFIIVLVLPVQLRDEQERKKLVAVNDERNVRRREKVGAKTNQIMVYVLSALVLALGFMNADLVVILMVAALFLVEIILVIGLTQYYSQRM